MNNKKKSLIEQYLFEIEIFCNIIDVFTVNFGQFNVSNAYKCISMRNI